MANEYLIQGSLILDVADASRKLDTVKNKTSEVERQTGKSTESMGLDWDKIGKKMESVGGKLTKFVSLPLTAAGIAMVSYASDTFESLQQVEVVFGDNADAVKKWSESTLTNIGLAQGTALSMAGTFGDMGTSMGLPIDKAAEMSMGLVDLAGDLASFKNISIERAEVALKGVYTGETEALKSLGIVMTQNNLEQFALTQGINKKISAMTQDELVMLRYMYVMNATSNAHGDFQRNIDSVANQSRVAREGIKELAAEFGDNLLNAVSDVLKWVNGVIASFKDLDEGTQNVILIVGGLAIALGPIITSFGKIISGIGDIKKAFTNGTLSMATLGWVGGALLAVATIVALVDNVKRQNDKLFEHSNELKSNMEKLTTTMDTLKRDFEAEQEGITSTANLALDYIGRLEELEAQGLSTAESQQEYANTVKALETLIPNVSIAINEQTGLVEGGTEALRANIIAWRDAAVAQAILTRQEGEVLALADAYIALDKATKKQTENSQELTRVANEIIELETQRAKALGYTKEEWDSLGRTEQSAILRGQQNNKVIAEMNTKIGELKSEQQALEISQNELNEEVDKGTAAYKEAESQLATTNELVVEYTAAAENSAKATEENTGAIEDATEATKELTEEEKKALKAKEDLQKATMDMTEKIVNSYERIDTKGKISLKQATSNLRANNEATRKALENYNALIDMGYNVNFVNSLYEGGANGRRIMAEIVKDADNMGRELEQEYFTAGELAKEAFETTLEDIPPIIEDVGNKSVEAANSGGKKVGAAMGDGVVSGMNSKIKAVKNAAANLANAGPNSMKYTLAIASPSKKTAREVGAPMAQGIIVGFEEEIRNLKRKMNLSMGGLVSGLTSTQSDEASRASAQNQSKLIDALAGKAGGATITQNNTFTSKELTPYEQRVQLKKLDNDLAEVFA